MPNIKTLNSDDPNYEIAKDTSKSKTKINYKELAGRIIEGDKDSILQIEVESRAFYTHIKRGLLKRNLVFNKDYEMAYRTIGTNKYIFITKKG